MRPHTSRPRSPLRRTTRAAVPGLVLVLGLALSGPATAQIYRWVDANGQVHYTQTPPPSGPAQEVNPRVSPPSPEAAAAADAAAKALLERGAQRDQQAAQAAAAVDVDAERRAKLCAAAREQLAYLDSRPPRRFMVEGEGGEVERMGVDRWEAQHQEAQSAVAQNCG